MTCWKRRSTTKWIMQFFQFLKSSHILQWIWKALRNCLSQSPHILPFGTPSLPRPWACIQLAELSLSIQLACIFYKSYNPRVYKAKVLNTNKWNNNKKTCIFFFMVAEILPTMHILDNNNKIIFLERINGKYKWQKHNCTNH